MKTTLTVLLSGLLLCGCSQKQASSAGPAIDRVQAGKDIVWRGGVVLHVAKRDGPVLEGIRVTTTNSTITADSGTFSAGSLGNTTDVSSVTLALKNIRAVMTNATGGFTVTTTTGVVDYALHE